MIIAVLCGIFKAFTGYPISDRQDMLSTVGVISFLAIEILIECLIMLCCIKYLSNKGDGE